MAGVTIDSGELKMLRDIDVKHQPSRNKVMSGWITALRGGREALTAIGPILCEIEHYRMWEMDYGDPRRLLEVIGIYKLADTLDGVPQLLDEYVSRLVEGKPAQPVVVEVALIAKEKARAQAPDVEKQRRGGGVNNPHGLGGRSGKTSDDIDTVDSIHGVKPQRPSGTSRAAVIRRLAKDGRDDLLDRIESGELSANKAAIEAGFRRKPTPLEQVIKLLDKLDPGELRQIVEVCEVKLDAV